jgi:hypothetical protein
LSIDKSETTDDLFRLFARTGAQTDTWKAYKLCVFELSRDEIEKLHEEAPKLGLKKATHYGLLQEVTYADCNSDYLMRQPSNLSISELGRFRSNAKDSTRINPSITISNKLPHNVIETLHNVFIRDFVGASVFFEKNGTKLNPRAIGATHPTPSFIKAFAKVDGKVSLAPIYMGRSFSLIKQTMRPKEHHGLHSHELYMMLGEYKQKSQFLESKLVSDFVDRDDRISFIKRSQQTGQFIAVRIDSERIASSDIDLLKFDVADVLRVNMQKAKKLEYDIENIAGLAEVTDVTDEVLLRLDLKP